VKLCQHSSLRLRCTRPWKQNSSYWQTDVSATVPLSSANRIFGIIYLEFPYFFISLLTSTVALEVRKSKPLDISYKFNYATVTEIAIYTRTYIFFIFISLDTHMVTIFHVSITAIQSLL
jgi:hypothetical protein